MEKLKSQIADLDDNRLIIDKDCEQQNSSRIYK